MRTADDLLWRHLRELPAFRALLRAVEAGFYTDLPMARPVLDLGCGDGHFASMAFDEPLDAGFDPWREPLTEARGRGTYRVLAQAAGGRMPYPDGTFATVISNSVLEHIPRVQPVLAETARVLQPGGWFYFCVPGPSFLPFLSMGRALDRLGLRDLGDAYRRLFNQISRHYHCDGAKVWERRLEAAGMRLIRWWPYFPRRALVALEWGHYLGLPALVSKALTGRWVLWPSRANLWLTERLVRPIYEASATDASSALSFDGSFDVSGVESTEEADGSHPQGAQHPRDGGHPSAGAYLFFVARADGSHPRGAQHPADGASTGGKHSGAGVAS